MKRKNYLSPQLKVLTMNLCQEVLVGSIQEEEMPTIGSEDLDIDFTQPLPGVPEDAF